MRARNSEKLRGALLADYKTAFGKACRKNNRGTRTAVSIRPSQSTAVVSITPMQNSCFCWYKTPSGHGCDLTWLF